MVYLCTVPDRIQECGPGGPEVDGWGVGGIYKGQSKRSERVDAEPEQREAWFMK